MIEYKRKLPKGYRMKFRSIYAKCPECNAEGIFSPHHMIHGKNRRKYSDYYELVVYLCDYCHLQLHRHNPVLDLKYKIKAQKRFEEMFSHEQYMEIFETNYLGGQNG